MINSSKIIPIKNNIIDDIENSYILKKKHFNNHKNKIIIIEPIIPITLPENEIILLPDEKNNFFKFFEELIKKYSILYEKSMYTLKYFIKIFRENCLIIFLFCIFMGALCSILY
jgi:hypothetical protein